MDLLLAAPVTTMTAERADQIKAECRAAIIDLEIDGHVEPALKLLAVMDALDRYIRERNHAERN